MTNNRLKTGGRTKGTPNKITSEIKESLKILLESNLQRLQTDIDSLEPKDRLRTLLELSKIVLPMYDNQINLDTEQILIKINFNNSTETNNNTIII